MKRYITYLLPFAFLLLSCNQKPSTKSSEQLRIDSVILSFENRLLSDLNTDHLNGSISAAIVKDDQLLWAKAFGYRDPENKKAADTPTIYRAGSITKSLTAMLMMQLAEKGKLNINDPVERYLPEVKQLKGYSDQHPITLVQLASHTSGLGREPELPGAVQGPISEWESKLLACIPTTSIDTIPGTAFNYSNIGYGILGLALSRAAGKPYIELIEDDIMQPLQMTRSFFVVPEKLSTDIATGMAGGPGDSIDINRPRSDLAGRGYKVPNGGLFCTAVDLSKFLRALMGHPKIVDAKSLDMMYQLHPPASSYGLGLAVMQEQGVHFIGHNGSVPGYTASAAFDKNTGYGVVLMRNYNSGATNLDEVAFELLAQLASP